MCGCSKTGAQLNAKHFVSCYEKVNAEINARHDIVGNILVNNIPIQRGLISYVPRWEDLMTVRTDKDEITVGTEHQLSEEWNEQCQVTGVKMRPDLVWVRRDFGRPVEKGLVDVKVTSTDNINNAFKEKDDKYREWTAKET